MCIICRGRFNQKVLNRFQKIDGKIVRYQNLGRSFYVCNNCIKCEEEKIKKIVMNRLKIKTKNIEEFGKILKELDTNG
jgi:predicted RNA-binding protein YlxR (DUF448 family)